MTDPISDMLTRIRNAVRARHPRVEIPHSNMKLAIASILKAEGYIAGVASGEKDKLKSIRVRRPYDDEGTRIRSSIQMVRRPGRRRGAGCGEIRPGTGGRGVGR